MITYRVGDDGYPEINEIMCKKKRLSNLDSLLRKYQSLLLLFNFNNLIRRFKGSYTVFTIFLVNLRNITMSNNR